MKALEGIRVLDLSRVYAAPAGSMILGDLGAEVIRIEQPGGSDSTRGWGPYIHDQSTYYLCANYKKFCTLIERTEWITDPRFATNSARKQHEEELVALLSPIIAQKTRDEWIALIQQYKIPGGRVNTITEALAQPQIVARDVIGTVTHPSYGQVRFVKNPLQHSSLNITYDLAPPLLGEHNEKILKYYI